MKKVKSFSKVKNRKTHLPLLVQADPEETGEAVRFTEFNIKDFSKKLEQALLKHPEFRPPYTTADMPACILDYKVYPDFCRKDGFTLHVNLLPGDKVPQYYEELLEQLSATSQKH